MILECPSCHARYLVHIGAFAGGGRQVRCARCKHQWHATLPTTIDVFVPLRTEPEPVPPVIAATDAAASLTASPPTMMPSALSQTEPLPGGLNIHLPAVVKNFVWPEQARLFFKGFKFFAKVSIVIGAVIVWPIMDREQIMVVMPETSSLYEFFHLTAKHSGGGLIFDQVKSELKYDSGMMHLVVDGVIHNMTPEMQFIPNIKAQALGPDSRVIQSWWIPAPAATIAAASDLPFHSEVNASMKQTIEDVYLEFHAQDENTDAVQ